MISHPLVHVPVAARAVLIGAVTLLLIAALILLPRPVRTEHVVRPSRPEVVAAIKTGKYEQIAGRVMSLDRNGLVVRVLLGTRKVANIHRTTYRGAAGSSLPRGALRKGDHVTVRGFRSGDVLLAVIVQDTSRK